MIYERTVTIRNQEGLHERPAKSFALKANQFSGSVWIKTNQRRVNAKSFLGILCLNITGGTEITIMSENKTAVDALAEFAESGLQE